MKKGSIIFLTICMLVFCAVGFSGCGNDADQTADQTGGKTEVLKVGTSFTPIDGKHVIYQIMEFLEEEVEKETNGKFDLELHHSGQLGQERDFIEGISMGTYKFGTACSVFGNLSDAYNVFDMPYLFKDFDHFARVCRSDIAKDLGKTLEKENIVVLGTGLSGGKYHVSNSVRPIKTVADMKGLKIRTMESPLILETMNALGASAIPMAWSDVYTGCQQGTIDGVCTVNPGFLSIKLHEVQDYLSQLGITYSPQLVIANKQWWDGLSEEDRTAIQTAVDRAMERHYEDMKVQEDQMKQNLIDTGLIEVLDQEDIDIEGFRKAVE
ncbi:MAG: TRAP transporter substrate-binding protein, partial [Clostridia bacterium]|nr:TRAP transporter substrate-binding protein [Clostridia bacterium]